MPNPALANRNPRAPQPRVDVFENDTEFNLKIEIPGALKDDVKIWVENDLLIVSGEKKRNISEDDQAIISERNFGRFQRSFRLPDNADRNNIEAELQNGVLVIVLKKSAESKPKDISIK